MADCTHKLQATISAAVESLQTGFDSSIVQSVRFNCALTLLFGLQYKQQSIRTARGQWHHCFILCRVVQSQDVSPHYFEYLALSGLAFSVAPAHVFFLYVCYKNHAWAHKDPEKLFPAGATLPYLHFLARRLYCIPFVQTGFGFNPKISFGLLVQMSWTVWFRRRIFVNDISAKRCFSTSILSGVVIFSYSDTRICEKV